MTAVLPPARVAIAGNAPPSREWYRYFQAATKVNLDVDALRHDVDALTVRVTALEETTPSGGDTKITGTGSIYISATAVKVVSLEGDAEDPGFTTYYGTDSTGAKGWYAVSDALASSGNIAKSTDAAGVTSFDMVDLADSGTGAALVKITRDAKGRISGTSAATTTDLAEGTNLYFTNARADARITLQKAQPLGLATLDAAGKLDAGQLPALAITETFVVNTQAAMLALSAQEGDVAVRTDLSKSFILTASPASTLSNWQELLTPMSPVTSVFGRTGAVTAASGDYTPAQVGAEPAITAGTTSQYRRGDKTWRDFATDVRAAVLTGLSTATSAVIAATDTVLGALGKLQAQITAGDTRTQTALDRSGFKNLIINGDFAINQRVFGGGALAAGVYGYDRWKAGASGCTASLSGGTLTHTSGSLVQIMEAPGIAGQTITVSVEDPSGSVGVDVDGATGTITAGSGRRGVAIAVPSGSTGNVTLTITATSATYKRVQVEIGPTPTAWRARPAAVEIAMCQRYYEKSYDLATPAGTADAFNGAIVFWNPNTSGNTRYPVTLAVQKRVPPTVTLYSLHTGAANAIYNNSAGSDITSFAVGAFVGQHGFIAGCANPLAVNEMRLHFTADAEL